MNYLAHLLLAGDNPEYLVGHMLGDFVVPREIAAYPAGIRAGIRMHQRVDAFSDLHPVFNASRRRFQPPYRRYAGILVDLAYDHFLAKHWHEYCAQVTLGEFARHAYGVLQQHHKILPANLQRVLGYMSKHDWLSSYRDLENIGRALRGISRNLRFENPLAEGIVVIEANREGLEDDFRLFFPDLVKFAAGMERAANEAANNAQTSFGELAPQSFRAKT